MIDESDEWSGDEIEEAYRKALAALKDVPWEPEADEPPVVGTGEDALQVGEASTAQGNAGEATGEARPDSADPSSIDAPRAEIAVDAAGPRLAGGTERHPRIAGGEHSNVTPAQVIEAALFVGGTPLTTKKFLSLLRGSFDAAFVERTIDELNEQYVSECRPYEIRLGDGGYRLQLRPEHEKLRQRVYGAGPREVKLSQDVLEVLALVAYRQPLSQEEVEAHGKSNSGSVLRQLLRRDLVAIQRGEKGRKDIRYHTTPRFLTVFGLGSLNELPQPEDLARK